MRASLASAVLLSGLLTSSIALAQGTAPQTSPAAAPRPAPSAGTNAAPATGTAPATTPPTSAPGGAATPAPAGAGTPAGASPPAQAADGNPTNANPANATPTNVAPGNAAPTDPNASTTNPDGTTTPATLTPPPVVTPTPPATDITSPPASGDGPVTPRIELRHNLVTDIAVTGVMAAGLVTWGFVKTEVGIDKCVICDGAPGEANFLDDAFRNTFKRDDIGPSATASHILSYAGGPVMGFALTIGAAVYDKRSNEAPLNCLLVIEASLAAVLVKEALTAVIRRERPFVHALEGEAKKEALSEGDPLESFPGGHTTSIMAITASSATIASLRGYRLAPYIWVIGSTLGLTSMYLRIAADQHYFTDNLVGGIVGAAVGAGIPLLFHRRLEKDGTTASGGTGFLRGAMVTSNAVPGGRVVGLAWGF